MFTPTKYLRTVLMISVALLAACSNEPETWTLLESDHSVRHESALLAHEKKLVLLGGRGERAIEVYDAKNNTWQQHITPALEMHHFQAVSHEGLIYIIGALTGGWPEEDAVDTVYTYDPESQVFVATHPIPSTRKRGAAGLVSYQGSLYLLGGLTNGHMGGSVAWFDKYDPKTGKWSTLPDAPIARDHFQAIVVGHKLYAIAGRQTSHATGEGMSRTQAQIDVYDFTTHTWSTLPESSNLPIPRAGNMAFAYGDSIVIAGGESSAQTDAHAEVSIFDTNTLTWRSAPPLIQGRHGTGFGLIDDTLYTVSGSGKAGGEPELNNLESITLERLGLANKADENLEQLISFGEPAIIDLKGPQVTESDEINPFTHYLMVTHFSHASGKKVSVQGYFAGDGNAANTSTESGNVWRTKFTPQLKGQWRYTAKLYQGEDVVFAAPEQLNAKQSIVDVSGAFNVGEHMPAASFFAQNGQVSLKNGYFFFPHTERYWIKVGTNSPENFLSYHEIDGTYRASQQAREGEAKAPDYIHEFAPHVQDWEEGDALWQVNKGKGIIGASNYLANIGMQAQYFLTMNINGDGRDVWPYISHEEFERFDTSKLAQWDLIFQHLQSRGVLLHLVTQETENELLLDGGNTERQRSLYYRELIARFGYHNGLIWNLGEENGPSDWSPEGQTSEQRIAMSAYFAKHDPHQNPIFLHTMPSPHDKDNILPPLYGSRIEGMSFQIDNREQVFDEINKWRTLSQQNGAQDGQGWAITMDEIGMWHTGAKVDADDPTHDSLRRHALWGALMAGATGVEWYFGAHQPHNDLSSEDFRQRENLWKQTKIAADYFNALELVSLRPIADGAGLYHMASDTVNIVYAMPDDEISLSMSKGDYDIQWLDPISGESFEQEGMNNTDTGDVVFEPPASLKSRDRVLKITQR